MSQGGKSKRTVHIISAWSKANQLSLGQVKVDEKSNEITAIPKLEVIGKGVRSHRGIENNLHWQLDVFFREFINYIIKNAYIAAFFRNHDQSVC